MVPRLIPLLCLLLPLISQLTILPVRANDESVSQSSNAGMNDKEMENMDTDDAMHDNFDELDEEAQQEIIEQQFEELEHFLQASILNPDIQNLVENIKNDLHEELAELNNLTEMEIVEGMFENYFDLKFMETLFEEDPQELVNQMNEAGMVEAEDLEMYKENPELLYKNAKSEMFMELITLGTVGGFFDLEDTEDEFEGDGSEDVSAEL